MRLPGQRALMVCTAMLASSAIAIEPDGPSADIADRQSPANTSTQRTETFDRDPGWDGHNNRSAGTPVEVRQDFGYSPTRHAGGSSPGEIGGFITPAAEPAFYAKRIARRTFADRLTAAGTLACTGKHFHAVLGFFNSGAINEWRTPNSIVIRLYGRGDVFYAYVEYMTGRWRAGGDSPGGFATVIDEENGRPRLEGFAGNGAVHRWSLDYDPEGHNGAGSMTVTIGDQTAVCHLDPGHKQDGAVFDRFGLLNIVKSVDTGGELWLDDVTINGETDAFDANPDWEGHQNRRTYATTNLRPRFDFGFSPTNFAGGRASGELGGLVFRGDCRQADRMAFYADRLEDLSAARPLRASGKLAMRRGVSDSTTLIGFFRADDHQRPTDSQASGIPPNFLGAAIEGPSRDGFFLYPMFRFHNGEAGYANGDDRPHVLPDGAAHDWTLEYDPATSDKPGRIVVTMDGQATSVETGDTGAAAGTRFDRFGIVTTWIDGNAQQVYFDDLSYTCRQQ